MHVPPKFSHHLQKKVVDKHKTPTFHPLTSPDPAGKKGNKPRAVRNVVYTKGERGCFAGARVSRIVVVIIAAELC